MSVDHVTDCANTQVLSRCALATERTRGPTAIGWHTRRVITGDRLVGLDEILEARERISGRVHRTPLLSSLTAARVVASGSGVHLGGDRLFVKAEHLQKTGSFKARG